MLGKVTDRNAWPGGAGGRGQQEWFPATWKCIFNTCLESVQLPLRLHRPSENQGKSYFDLLWHGAFLFHRV